MSSKQLSRSFLHEFHCNLQSQADSLKRYPAKSKIKLTGCCNTSENEQFILNKVKSQNQTQNYNESYNSY